MQVSFTRTRYHEVIEKTAKQNKVMYFVVYLAWFTHTEIKVEGSRNIQGKDMIHTKCNTELKSRYRTYI